METLYIVYALFHRDHPERLRYAGLTTKSELVRLKGHWKAARRGLKYPVYFWMRKYSQEDIQVKILATYTTREEMILGEIAWIAELRKQGMADLNITDGGEGTSGWKMNDEQREFRRQFLLSNPIQYEITPEHRKAVGDSNRKRLSTQESRRDHANKTGKLRDGDVLKIKMDIFSGMSDKDCANKYKMSVQNSSNIRHGNSWGFVPWPIGPWEGVKLPERPVGESNPVSKITERDVVEMRRLVRTMTYSKVGELFNVSSALVNNVVRGKTWTHVPFEEGFPAISEDRDMSFQKNAVSGEKSGQAKLTDEKVRYIRMEASLGKSFVMLGKELGVSDATIGNVVHFKTWKHVK